MIYISGVAKRGKGGKLPPPSRNLGKYAKDGEQPRPQPAIRKDSSKKLKFLFNFSKFLLKFSLKLSKLF